MANISLCLTKQSHPLHETCLPSPSGPVAMSWQVLKKQRQNNSGRMDKMPRDVQILANPYTIPPSGLKKLKSSSLPSVPCLNFNSTPSYSGLTILTSGLPIHAPVTSLVAVFHSTETQEGFICKKVAPCKAEKVCIVSVNICFLWFFTAVS